MTPFGKLIYYRYFPNNYIAPGSRVDGLTMIVFPVPIALGIDHIGHIKGKLKGETQPVTPRGSKMLIVSIPFAIFIEVSPIIIVATAHPNSTSSYDL